MTFTSQLTTFTSQQIQKFLPLGGPAINRAPVIVLGHQKSGTSVIAALLAKSTGSTATLDFFWKNNHSLPFFRAKLHSGELSLSQLLRKNRQYLSADIIKEPELTYLYEQLSVPFPQATYVFVVREPKATLKSVLDRLKLPGDLSELSAHQYEQINPLSGWLPALQGEAPATLGENYIERLAHRWKKAAQTYLDHHEQMALIRYEDFLADKQGAIHQLAHSVGLTVAEDISEDVNRQFQRKGNHHVAITDFFGSENAATVDNICREEALQFGYEV